MCTESIVTHSMDSNGLKEQLHGYKAGNLKLKAAVKLLLRLLFICMPRLSLPHEIGQDYMSNSIAMP